MHKLNIKTNISLSSKLVTNRLLMQTTNGRFDSNRFSLNLKKCIFNFKNSKNSNFVNFNISISNITISNFNLAEIKLQLLLTLTAKFFLNLGMFVLIHDN